jgi:geranylgeranyl diphosphate synthase type II
MTYPSLIGIDESRERAKELVAEAIKSIRKFPSEADPLREIARYLIKRRT